MNRHPRVSIVVPTFNAGDFLRDTLESVLAQSFQDFELLLVDDGSTDNTATIAGFYGSRVSYVRQPNSGGPSRPRNVGIDMARGTYICFFDADDLMLPDKLARSVDFIENHPDLGLILTDFVKFDPRGVVGGTHMGAYTHFLSQPRTRLTAGRYRVESRVAFEALFFGNYVGTSSVLVPAAVLKAVGPFDEEVSRGGLEDRDMWFRIARHYDFGFLDFVGHQYRMRPDGVSKRAIHAAEGRVKVIRRYVGPELNRATRRQANRVMADSIFTIGDQLRRAGDTREARIRFLESIRTHPTWAAVRGYVLTLLGARSIAWLRRLRRSSGQGHEGGIAGVRLQ